MGASVGIGVGAFVGSGVGTSVGINVGVAVGSTIGACVGSVVSTVSTGVGFVFEWKKIAEPRATSTTAINPPIISETFFVFFGIEMSFFSGAASEPVTGSASVSDSALCFRSNPLFSNASQNLKTYSSSDMLYFIIACNVPIWSCMSSGSSVFSK